MSSSSVKPSILLVSHFYSAHRGGVEIVAGTLAEFLAHQGDVTIRWMASDTNPSPEGIPELHCIPARATNVVEERLQLPYPLWSLRSLLRLWQEVRTADVVHLHDYLYAGNIAAFVFAKLCRKPVAITQHIGFIPYDSALLRGILSNLNRTLGALILGQAEQTVFISEVVQTYFASNIRYRHDPLLIPNGVDTETFCPADEPQRQAIRQELDLPSDRPVFLFVGRFVEKKGLPILWELVERFPTIHWAFAGWGTLDPEGWGLPNVRVFRDRKGSQLVPLYQAADLLVLPSKGEGFPLVVQEAMACGTPVMVGRETASGYSAAAPLMLSEEVEGSNTIDLWSARVEALLQENCVSLTELRPKVAAFTREHWSWQTCAERYGQLFCKLTYR
jgi:glycosyltransferase involved in cell wall biosynthesis